MKKYFIDLCCGIGGIRQSFENNGCECVFACEIDKFAQKTYFENYKTMPFGDINKIKLEEIPYFDILTAGFPCQPFSVGGKKLGLYDHRSNVIFSIFNIIKYHKPKACLFENVKGLTCGKMRSSFNFIINSLNDLGYNVYYDILNANRFNLVQHRERLIIVCFRKDIDLKLNFAFPQGKRNELTIKSILETQVEEKYTISNKCFDGLKRRDNLNIKKRLGYRSKIHNINDKHTNTITARYYKDGKDCLIAQENKNPRKLTPREVARLQGFKDDFKIVVSDCQAYKQFGNSVPINMIEAVAQKMLEYIKKGD